MNRRECAIACTGRYLEGVWLVALVGCSSLSLPVHLHIFSSCSCCLHSIDLLVSDLLSGSILFHHIAACSVDISHSLLAALCRTDNDGSLSSATEKCSAKKTLKLLVVAGL